MLSFNSSGSMNFSSFRRVNNRYFHIFFFNFSAVQQFSETFAATFEIVITRRIFHFSCCIPKWTDLVIRVRNVWQMKFLFLQRRLSRYEKARGVCLFLSANLDKKKKKKERSTMSERTLSQGYDIIHPAFSQFFLFRLIPRAVAKADRGMESLDDCRSEGSR